MKKQLLYVFLFLGMSMALSSNCIAQSDKVTSKKAYPITDNNKGLKATNQFDLVSSSVDKISEADLDLLYQLRNTLELKIQSVQNNVEKLTPLQNQLSRLNQAIAIKEQ